MGNTVIGIDDFNDYYDPKLKKNNIAPHLANKKFILIKKDISEGFDWEQLLKTQPKLKRNGQIDLVIHLAARAGVRGSLVHPFLYEKVNYAGTLHVLELIRNLRIKKIIFGSSSSVYGNLNKVPFKETDENWPISPYGVTKRAGELLCHAYSKLFDISVICLRFFTVYGPRNRPDMAAFRFMEAINKGNEIKLYGKSTLRDFTFVNDIVDGIIRAINKIMPSPPRFEIINLGNSSPVSILEFVHTLERIVGKEAKIILSKLPPGDMEKTFADIRKAKRLLAWEPSTPLAAGLKKLWQWYKINNILP